MIILGTALAGWLVMRQLAAVNDSSSIIVDKVLPIRSELNLARQGMTNFRMGEARHILSTDDAAIAAEDASLQKLSAGVDASLQNVMPLLATEAEGAAVQQIKTAWRDYVSGEEAVLALSRANKNDEAFRKYGQSNGTFENLQAQLEAFVRKQTEKSSKLRATSQEIYTTVTTGTTVVIGFVLLAASAAAWYFESNVTRAIIHLANSMGRIAQGDLATDVPSIARADELGAMAKTVQTFKDNGLAMRRLEAEAAAQRELSEAQRAKADEAREAAAQQRLEAEAERARAAAAGEAAAARQAEAMEAIGNGLAQLAAGNLTVVLNTAFAPEYESVRADFNSAVRGVQDTVREIMGHSSAIARGTGEISNAADDLARRTEQQAAGLEQTAAALDEITNRVKQSAASSGEAQAIAVAAQNETESSERVVTEAVTAMGEIDASARKIGQIIGVIDEIAFQTNLLALNAGVEAARAGEAGRGFAVVASEVRALAQRAADAAKEIKTLVTNSMRQVERGVKLVGDTGEALGRIQVGVIKINKAIGEIAASAKEQATGLAEVNIAVNEMDHVTQQNASMVEESTSAVHELTQETEALNQAMARFRIANANAGSAHRPSRPDPAPPPPRRPARTGHQSAAAAADQEDFQGF
jgi:methyl-accepting chemotaxis protein